MDDPRASRPPARNRATTLRHATRGTSRRNDMKMTGAEGVCWQGATLLMAAATALLASAPTASAAGISIGGLELPFSNIFGRVPSAIVSDLAEYANPRTLLETPMALTDATLSTLDSLWQVQLQDLVQNLPYQEIPVTQQQQGSLDMNHLRGTRALVTNNGYPVEEHTVRTDDGYLLTMFRLPRPGRPAVLLMHGLLSSSADYIILGRGRALALLLFDAGFDVWLANARGNTASRRHVSLSPWDPKFWDFSWHEVGVSDLPASIDHVLATTNQSALHYIGHSQGTTSFFVLGSEKPEYMDKVKTFSALAPVAFLRDVRSVPIRLMALAPNTLALIFQLVGVNEFLPSNSFISWLGDRLCADGEVTQPICYHVTFLIGGTDSQQMNATILPDILANTPAGAATKQLLHYGQLVHQSRLRFRHFDHGWLGNMARYSRFTPPDYDLSRVTAKTYLIHSDNDLLAVQSNVDELARQLPNVAPDGMRRVSLSLFNHLDYLFAKNAKELVYDDVIAIIRENEEDEAEPAAPSSGRSSERR